MTMDYFLYFVNRKYIILVISEIFLFDNDTKYRGLLVKRYFK